MSLLLLLGGALASLGALFVGPWRAARRRRRAADAPFPAAWRGALRRRVPLVRELPPPLQWRLKQLIRVFLAEVPVIGCGGLVVTDEMRVTVAAQACLLVLHRTGRPFPALRQVQLYPDAFKVDRVRHAPGGVLQEHRQVLSGESWSQGYVVLSWQDTLDGAADPHDGRNVVLHEFAHQLDQETGAATGAPRLANRDAAARWTAVMSSAYRRLQSQLRAGEATVLDAYGASDPAEFFAVATEAFFELPGALSADDPALYRTLADYYRVDPLAWR